MDDWKPLRLNKVRRAEIITRVVRASISVTEFRSKWTDDVATIEATKFAGREAAEEIAQKEFELSILQTLDLVWTSSLPGWRPRSWTSTPSPRWYSTGGCSACMGVKPADPLMLVFGVSQCCNSLARSSASQLPSFPASQLPSFPASACP